jgi:hypothetical protein
MGTVIEGKTMSLLTDEDFSPIGWAAEHATSLIRKSASATIPVMATPQQGQAPAAQADPVVKLLAVYESKPLGSGERIQAFREVLKAVHDERHAK